MTKEQLNVAIAMLDAHAEERRRQHAEVMAKLDQVIKNTKQELYVWIPVIALFTFMAIETVVSLVN